MLFKHIATIVFFITLPAMAFCQDILTTKDGTELKVKVIEITDKSVKYKSFDNPDGPIYSTDKDGVLLIKYENGQKDIFKSEMTEIDYYQNLTMEEQGKLDAEEYYHRYHGARLGTYITTSLGGALIGLIPAIACSSRMPADHRLDYPDSTLMKNKEYRKAYKHTAKKIKQGKTWSGYGLGIITAIVLQVAAIFIILGA